MTFNTEVFIFDTSEAFRENQEIVTTALKSTLKAEGANAPGYYGIQIENPGTGYIIIHWDSHEKHKAFSNSPSFPAISGSFIPSLGGKRTVYDVEFSGPTISVEQPVTEIFICTLKAPENREAVVDMFTKFSQANNQIVFGQTRQDENKYIVLCGWPSVEAHREAAKKPELVAALTMLSSLVNKEHSCHTSFTKCSP